MPWIDDVYKTDVLALQDGKTLVVCREDCFRYNRCGWRSPTFIGRTIPSDWVNSKLVFTPSVMCPAGRDDEAPEVRLERERKLLREEECKPAKKDVPPPEYDPRDVAFPPGFTGRIEIQQPGSIVQVPAPPSSGGLPAVLFGAVSGGIVGLILGYWWAWSAMGGTM